jgi:DNA-binding CsgD family transcriptional regulator
VAFATVAGVGLSLALAGALASPWVPGGLALLVVLLPAWPWTRRLSQGWYFALVLFDGALVTAGLYLSGHPGTVLILFFVLIPLCARMPRPFSLLCYVLFPLMTVTPYLFLGPRFGSWADLASFLPGFLAIIAFTEAFSEVRRSHQDKERLLDELVEAQKRLQPPGPPEVPAGTAVPFTRREREVLGLVAMGLSNKEIAERLFLAEGTVKNRVSSILEKSGVRDRTQAALRARELGIL